VTTVRARSRPSGQRDDHRYLVGLGVDLGLGRDDAPRAGQGGQQVNLDTGMICAVKDA